MPSGAGARLRRRRTPARLLALCLLLPAAGAALETDQYYAWGRSLKDATAVLNAKLELELEHAAAEVNQSGSAGTCEEVAARLHQRLHFSTFQNFELWAWKTDLLERAPADAAEERLYRKVNLYSASGFLDIGASLPDSPTIEVNGIRLGTDKLAHFVSSGWRWYQNYLAGLREGLDPVQAELRVVRDGVFWERTMLGGTASGVTSRADLEAGYQGMLFYRGLCHGDQPTLARGENGWAVARPFDIGAVVSPEWDESYQTSIYTAHRWRHVRPVLLTYCDRLSLPSVQAERERYRELDSVTPVERVFQPLVASGRVDDPRQFSIEANCKAEVPGAAPEPPEASRPVHAAPVDPAEEDVVAEHDADSGVRAVGLLGLNLSHPDTASLSGGVVLVSLPVASDCTTVCPVKGPALQLGLGLGGGRLSLGWAHLVGDTQGKGLVVSRPYIGLAFKGTLLYTWGQPWREPTGAAFLGGEFEFTIVQVNFRVGAFRHVGGTEPDDPWLLSGGIGWGF